MTGKVRNLYPVADAPVDGEVRPGPLRSGDAEPQRADVRTVLDRAALRKPYGGNAAKIAARVAALDASQKRRADLAARWSHKNEGTPETHEKFNSKPERRRDWPLARMARLGTIEIDDLASGEEIASVIEMIERDVGMGAGSVEARVDCSNSARDALVESLGRVRLEVAYRGWRAAIPEPKRMVLDMLTTNVSYVELARIHGMHWRTAKKILIRSLRLWPTYRIEARRDIDREEVEDIYQRLGEGVLLQPKPKEEPAGSIADHDAR